MLPGLRPTNLVWPRCSEQWMRVASQKIYVAAKAIFEKDREEK
jgi:hypothetical protein